MRVQNCGIVFYVTLSCLIVLIGESLLPEVCQADQYTEVHPSLVGYDSTQHIHIDTPAQADAVRQSVIDFFWSSGEVPTSTLPTSVTAVYSGAGSLPSQLGGVSASLVESVEQLNMSTDDLATHAYLIHPETPAAERKLAIVHQGHQANLLGGLDTTTNYFLQIGYDVLAMNMPLLGWNPDRTVTLPDGTSLTTGSHSTLMNSFGVQNDNGFRFFVDPVVTGINYFVNQQPDYTDVFMTGLSGGGWTTAVVPAVDTRINLSVPVAGSTPLYIRDIQPSSVGDLEQTWAGLYVDRASWLDLYILAGYGEGREQIQVNNQFDSCCFSGINYTTYEDNVANAVDSLGEGKWSFALDTTHTSHLISEWTLTQVIAPAVSGPAWNGVEGDVNQNDVFFGDGSGPAETDDVTAFLEGWGSTGLPGLFGSLESYTHGDLNFDGQTDLYDAVVMWTLLRQEGTSTAALEQFFAGAPEPSSFALLLLAVSGICLCHPRRGMGSMLVECRYTGSTLQHDDRR